MDDGERLATIADATQDFVIANHFLEHCQDPLGALGNMSACCDPGACSTSPCRTSGTRSTPTGR